MENCSRILRDIVGGDSKSSKACETMSFVFWCCVLVTILFFFVWYFGFVEEKHRQAPLLALGGLVLVAIGSAAMLFRK
jgi:small-conductance mechanosensitive channel